VRSLLAFAMTHSIAQGRSSNVPTEYDADIIRHQADPLYDEADRAVLASIIIMGVLGVLVGAASFYLLAKRSEALSIVPALGAPIVGAVIGPRSVKVALSSSDPRPSSFWC